MLPSAILQEAQQLHNVSDRLDMLADQYSLVSEALITISGNVRHTAALLEVLVAMKMGQFSTPGSANALGYVSQPAEMPTPQSLSNLNP